MVPHHVGSLGSQQRFLENGQCWALETIHLASDALGGGEDGITTMQAKEEIRAATARSKGGKDKRNITEECGCEGKRRGGLRADAQEMMGLTGTRHRCSQAGEVQAEFGACVVYQGADIQWEVVTQARKSESRRH